jgi:hypothetical protein
MTREILFVQDLTGQSQLMVLDGGKSMLSE